ncbi:hypothetical protein AA0115_g8383 [Alternaria tenuissima]|uniref:Uncharacterized protein n=1 Tax=Alternaria tenuissima TaxID=119927 RepID=A0AB37W9P7_9PLEO|nr:hypothetical protein AA0115_g8383 [Alternaria tenuissima]
MVPSSLTPRNSVVLGPKDMNLAHVASNVARIDSTPKIDFLSLVMNSPANPQAESQ